MIFVNDPELTACPDNITECGPQNIFWEAPTATDADGCEEPVVTSTHNSGDFFTVGTTMVTYTATDGAEGTDECSFTVTINPLPSVTIEQEDLPEWCQGVQVLTAVVANEGDLAPPLEFLWTTNETNSQITAYANGPYDVVVTDANGCMGTAYADVDEDLEALIERPYHHRR